MTPQAKAAVDVAKAALVLCGTAHARACAKAFDCMDPAERARLNALHVLGWLDHPNTTRGERASYWAALQAVAAAGAALEAADAATARA